jgi:superfamily II DNA or RNA helicase
MCCFGLAGGAIMTELRPYQNDVLAEVDRAIAEGKRRIIIVAPTGAGKTIIAAAIIKAAIATQSSEASDDF